MQQLTSNTLLHGGTYRIEKVLGQGSFGITYLGVHTSLDRKVAIKEFFMKELNSRSDDGSITGLTDGSLSFNYARKFKKEAQNLARLEHPNIVRVTDCFDENGTFYYVMDYIEGENLNDYIKHQHISQNEAISIITDIAKALQYMHEEKHMLHLDLKPGNVMRRSSDGHVFLIDFGLSKHYSSDGQPETSTTIGLGTAGYAPIEQANQAKNGEFRPTIDVYALGATLYKLLTRQTPPAASDVVSDDEIIKDGLHAAGITGNVIEVVTNAMMPSVKKRTQTVSMFLNAFNKTTASVYSHQTPPNAAGQRENIYDNSVNSLSNNSNEETIAYNTYWEASSEKSSHQTPPNAAGKRESIYSENVDSRSDDSKSHINNDGNKSSNMEQNENETLGKYVHLAKQARPWIAIIMLFVFAFDSFLLIDPYAPIFGSMEQIICYNIIHNVGEWILFICLGLTAINKNKKVYLALVTCGIISWLGSWIINYNLYCTYYPDETALTSARTFTDLCGAGLLTVSAIVGIMSRKQFTKNIILFVSMLIYGILGLIHSETINTEGVGHLALAIMCIVACDFKQPFSYKGRIQRFAFCKSVIVAATSSLIIFGVMVSIIDTFASNNNAGPIAIVVVIPLYVIFLWFLTAQRCKRCHDRGNSGWWQIIPYYDLWLLFGGSDEDNGYGSVPCELE